MFKNVLRLEAIKSFAFACPVLTGYMSCIGLPFSLFT